jgi:hypothetical protein
MSTFGLMEKFKLNRPLTEQEITDHLPQKQATRSEPFFRFSVIKMNSTFLECVDKWFKDRGLINFLCGGGLILCGPAYPFAIYLILRDWATLSQAKQDEAFWVTIMLTVVFIPSLLLFFYGFMKENFRLTHYPMRFNRKTRKVHFFRTDGKVVTADWDNIYFTLWRPRGAVVAAVNGCEILGHVIAEDGKTVLETFGLPHEGSDDNKEENPVLWEQWEFVRRYMEEPAQLGELADQVNDIVDIAERREHFFHGMRRLVGDLSIEALIRLPLTLPIIIARWLANHTCRIPKWPAGIEAECQIDPDDPYIRDADHLAHQEEDIPPPASSPAFTLADLQTQEGMERYVLSTFSPEMSETEKRALLEAKRPDFDAIRAKFAREERKTRKKD